MPKLSVMALCFGLGATVAVADPCSVERPVAMVELHKDALGALQNYLSLPKDSTDDSRLSALQAVVVEADRLYVARNEHAWPIPLLLYIVETELSLRLWALETSLAFRDIGQVLKATDGAISGVLSVLTIGDRANAALDQWAAYAKLHGC